MSIERSAYVKWLRERAPERALKEQVAALLRVVNAETTSATKALTQFPLRNEHLEELMKWNHHLAASPVRDQIGTNAAEFFVAQTLATTVMRPKALDQIFSYGAEVDAVMAKGGDGIFEVGRPQFELLAHLAKALVDWMSAKGSRKPLLVESPLGNSLVVQVVGDYASKKGFPVETYTWMTPRNERQNRGITLRESAKWLKEAAAEHNVVIFIDDVSTGTRFKKMLDAMVRELGEDKLVAIALAVPQETAKNQERRQKLQANLVKLSAKHGFKTVWNELPYLRGFKFDDGPYCKWHNPLVWQDSDLIAGKRKVNLIFTLLDHLFVIIDDLASEQSYHRNRLEHIWTQNTAGDHFVMAPGLTQSTFQKINATLECSKVKAMIEASARTEFPSDYAGKLLLGGDEDAFVMQRWDWLRTSFIASANETMQANLARIIHNACVDGPDTMFSAVL